MKKILIYIKKIFFYTIGIFVILYIIMQIFLSYGFEIGERGDIEKYFEKFSCETDNDCENKKNFDYCSNVNYDGRIKLTPWKDYETNTEVGCQCILHHCMKK